MTISLNVYGKIDSLIATTIQSIHDVAFGLGIPFFIVGATARDIILRHGYGIEPMRATRDIDFAANVETWNEFEQLKQHLVDTQKFEFTRDAHRLMSHLGLPVDIIPFGAIADSGVVSWPPEYDMSMSVEGFAECYRNSIEVYIDKNAKTGIRIASLEGVALLKLISWNENPHERNKDALDVFIIVKNYIDAGNQDRVFDEARDLFEEAEDHDYDTVSAAFLGRNISKILADSEFLKRKVISILEQETKTERPRGFIHSIVTSGSFPNYSYGRVMTLLNALLRGLK